MQMEQSMCAQVKKPIVLKPDTYRPPNQIAVGDMNHCLFQHVNGNGMVQSQQLNNGCLKNVIKLPSLKGMITKKMLGLPMIQTINGPCNQIVQ